MTQDTRTEPRPADAELDEGDDYAHIARKEDIARAAVLGGKVRALCGHQFEPVRDPRRFPVCPRCSALAGMLGWGGAGGS